MRGSVARVLWLAVVGAVAASLTGAAVGLAPGGESCPAGANAVVCENSRSDEPWSLWSGSQWTGWDIDGAGDPSIQGFATDISVNRGERIDFKVDTHVPYSITIYRIGWYGGQGARLVDRIDPARITARNQPECLSDPTTELLDCGNWGVSASWTAPADATSGVYIARLVRSDTGTANHIIFVVRDDSSRAAIVFQTSDPTWQAYNAFGGSNFYHGGANGRAYKISYNRPFTNRGDISGRDFFFSTEYPMIRFLERNGYDVTYTTGVDTDRHGDLLKNHKTFLSVGHDEYWSATQRANVEAARDAGVNLAFFSGNEVFWRTRWEKSVDGTGTPYRTLVCYKETWADAKIDPSDEWTGTWRDPRFRGSGDRARAENGLTGTLYMATNVDLAIQVTAQEGRLRLWRNTAAANMINGDVMTLAPHTLGYESDEDLDNGFRPPGLIRLSTTIGAVPDFLRDYGRLSTPGQTEHHMTLYRAASGALVFSAGTIQWSWGLDANHDGAQEPADERMQQATVNLLADMGAQPTTLDRVLVPATKSQDTQAPGTTVTSPRRDLSVTPGESVTVQGSARDSGDGQIASVEVSIDGGDRWHLATGTDLWSYTFKAQAGKTYLVRARAVDDSVNVGQPTNVIRVTSTAVTSTGTQNGGG
jgi:hypothetical protein